MPKAIFDFVVLGSDAAGTIAAREARRAGLRVAIVAPEAAAADSTEVLAEHALRLAAYQSAQVRMSTMRQGTGTVGADRSCATSWLDVARARAGRRPMGDDLASLGVKVLEGRPVFVRRDAVEVGGREVAFRRALLTAGLAAAPPVRNADGAELLVPRRLLEVQDLPRRIAVLGTGPRACQWAQTFRRLGCDVNLIGLEPSILAGEDPLATAVIEAQLVGEGVHLLLGCSAVDVQQTGTQRVVLLDREGRKEKRFVDRVFRVASQEPDLTGLGLETAGVAYTQGGVEVDDRLRTTNRRIFAAGNVCGGRFAAPEMVEAMARLCVHNAFHLRSKRLSRTVIPRCIWTDPEIARVGLTPAEAAERGIEIDTYRAKMSEIAAAVLDGQDKGFMIVYARHGTGRILGGTIVAARASELIDPLGLMIARRISLDALADGTVCRPSRFEVFALIADCYRRNQSPSQWRMLREKLRAYWRRA